MNVRKLETELAQHTDPIDLYNAVVNLPFGNVLHATTLGLGIVVLLLANEKLGTLDRIALSNTELAQGAVRMTSKPFHEIKIPLDYHENILVAALDTNLPQQTEDWATMFAPELSPKEARFNQAGAGIDCSIIYPLKTETTPAPFGAMIFSYFQPLQKIDDSHHAFMRDYSALAARALATLG